MAGRMSPLHSPSGGLVSGSSVPPASRNGGASNAAVNGSTLQLTGRRGAHFTLHIGALTGSAAVAAKLQTNDKPADPTNGNWSDVNATTYPNAAISNKTNANSTFEMDWSPAGQNTYAVRAVLTPEANVSLAGISHVIY